jgi:lysophospholipase
MELHSTPDNPAPDGAVAIAIKTRDGVALRGMTGLVPEARGTVVVVGGRGDFIERYFETMRDLMALGYSVAAFDLRGQGGSERPLANRYRNHVRRFSEYDEDLRAFMHQVVLPECPGPYLVIGHSTGGSVVIRALLRRNWFARAVVIAPLLGLNYGKWPLPIVHVLVFLANWTGFGWLFLPGQRQTPLGRNDFEGNPLSADHGRWGRNAGILEKTPELGTGAPTFAWLRAAMKSTRAMKRMGPKTRLQTPLLVVAAGLDRVVDNEQIRRFARRVPGVSLVTIAESQHEVLNEGDAIRQQFFAAFRTFVDG